MQNIQLSLGESLIENATTLDIKTYKEGYFVEVRGQKSFFVWPDSLDVPSELASYEVVKSPVSRVVTFSSTQWSVFEELGELHRVVGILEARYVEDTVVRRLVEEGKILNVGFENNVDNEKVVSLTPDVIITTPYPGSDYSQIEELTGAINIPFTDYLEASPLGRAEWLKLIGVLCDKPSETFSWFSELSENYNSLKRRCDSVNHRPTVFSDLPYQGQWYISGGKSYIAQLLRDAGADYVFSDDSTSGSHTIDPELLFLRAQNADFWRIMNSTGHEITREDILAQAPLLKDFKVIRENKIVVCDIYATRYFETATHHVDEVLSDLINIFHPELLPERENKYYFLGLE